MTTITTRSGKGSPLTNNEVDANFTNLNDDKVEASGDSMTGNLSFGDNNKAIFGAGSDLQIYSDGTDGYIDNVTGDFYIRDTTGGTLHLQAKTGEEGIVINDDGSVDLYRNNVLKMSTTSTGIDVTGTVVADGLTVDASTSQMITLNHSTPSNLTTLGQDSSGDFRVRSDSVNKLKSYANGDFELYEDTGTTPKFFWDASTERLGIGTTSPSVPLDVIGTATVGNGTYGIKLTYSAGNTSGIIDTADSADNLEFRIANTQRMKIDSSGIDVTGTVVADGLTVDGGTKFSGSADESSSGGLSLKAGLIDASISNSTDAFVGVHDTGGLGSLAGDLLLVPRSSTGVANSIQLFSGQTTPKLRQKIADNGDISFYEDTGTTAKLFWDASAERLGLGTTSPQRPFHLNIGTDNTAARFQSTDTEVALEFIDTAGTAYFRASGDYIKMGATQSDSLTILNGGNVGIGTSSPSALLQVGVPLSSTAGIRVSGSNLNVDAGYQSSNVFGTASAPSLIFGGDANTGLWHPASDTLAVSTAGAERMRIDSSGKVGIGTTPVRVLDIATTTGGTIIHLTDDATGHTATDGVDLQQEGTLFQILNREAGDIRFGTNNTERMRIDSSGNVIFGTSGQGYINGAAPNTYNSGYDQDNDSFATWINFSGYQGGTTRYRDLIVGNGKNARIATFDGSTGNVGIGTTSPSNLLTISDATTAKLELNRNGTIGNGWIVSTDSAANEEVAIQMYNSEFRLYNNSTQNFTVTSGGNVGIGTSSPSRPLDVTRSVGSIIANFKNTAGTLSFITLGNTSSTADQIRVGANGTALTLSTNYAERMRIDSSGNLLVGKTSAVGASTVGIEVRPNGDLISTRSGNQPLTLNRTTSDGTIAQFRKDNTTVGSIGADGGAIYIGNTAGEKLKFHNGSGGSFYPATDNNNDLGATSNRFKDLYLSGGAYLGGTGSANHLDDFEEGDHTTSITCTTSGTVTLNTTFDSISYVKVGRLVTVTGLVIVGSVSSPVGAFSISMPFSAASSGVAKRGSDSAAAITVHNGVSANSADYVSTITGGESELTVSLGDDPDIQTDSAQQLQTGTQIYFHICYPTN